MPWGLPQQEICHENKVVISYYTNCIENTVCIIMFHLFFLKKKKDFAIKFHHVEKYSLVIFFLADA